MKKPTDKPYLYYITLTFLIVIAIFGAVSIKKFVGFATYIASQAGYITEVKIDHRLPTVYWQGYYGLALMVQGYNETQYDNSYPGGVSSKHLIFTCLEPNIGHEVYAANVPPLSLSWSSVSAANPAYVDNYYGLNSSELDSVTRTFTDTISVEIGSQNITNIPATHTKVFGSQGSATFDIGILNVSNAIVFVAHIAPITAGFNNQQVNYQMILPARNTTRYYFFADPNDNCPEGMGTGYFGDGYVVGYAFENSTGVPLANVTINVGGVSNITDANGFYNLTVQTGNYNVIGIKSGYSPYINIVNVSLALTVYHNITMSKAPITLNNGTIQGTITDNSTSLPIQNVTVSIAGVSILTNSNGEYNITTTDGPNNLVAIKNNYDSYISNVTIPTNSVLVHNIIIEQRTGTVSGSVKDNLTGLLLSGVTVSASGKYDITNSSGDYSLTITKGETFIIADKQGYNKVASNITIYGGRTSRLNIAMEMTGQNFRNGTIQGTTKDNSTGSALANVTVSLAGVSVLTNSNGFYNASVLEGLHNIVATKTNYNNFIGNATVLAGNITAYNISMSPFEVIPGLKTNGIIAGIVKSASGSLLSGVVVSAAGQSATTTSLGNYSLSVVAGTHNLVATKSGYDNYIGVVNVTEGNLTGHNITMAPSLALLTGVGSGEGTGVGTGKGAGASSQEQKIPRLEKPLEVADFKISINNIIKKLRAGTYLDIPISISNQRAEPISVYFSFEGDVGSFVKLDNDKMFIDANSDGELKLTIFGYEEGVYSGNLIISGDINDKIPINLIIYGKEKLPVEALLLKTDLVKKRVNPGETFKYRLDLTNMLSETKYIVSLSYSMDAIGGNQSIFIEKEDIVIITSFSLLKSFVIPEDTEPGDYTLTIRANYIEQSTTHKASFSVVQPLYKYALFGVMPLWIVLVLVSVVSTGTFSIMVYKKKSQEKKRYKTKLDSTHLPKEGSRSAFVGNIAETNTHAYFDLDLFQVHTLVAGASGSGKTIIAQDLVEEALLKKVAVLVFDPTAQWTGFLRKCDDKPMLNLYGKFGMRKKDSTGFNGNVYQVNNPREVIDIKKFMKPGEINILVTNKLDTKGNELFVANAIREIFHAHLPESKELIFLMVYDGIHSLLPKFGGTGEVFVQVERATREFRKWGVGLLLISQVLNDFPPEVLANINTQIQARTRDEKDLDIIREEYGEDTLRSIVKATVGAGMVENSAYNNGKPYFIAFRPLLHSTKRLGDAELENYNKFNNIIDDLEFQIEQLEKEGIDVFDLRLELKLSQDKVKSGNFNMVSIYLDSLVPRISSQWSKLGKSPKKKEIKLVSEDELKKEFKKTKGEKEINELIGQVYDCISKSQKDKALALYSELTATYKELPKEAKADIFKKCVDIQKRMAK